MKKLKAKGEFNFKKTSSTLKFSHFPLLQRLKSISRNIFIIHSSIIQQIIRERHFFFNAKSSFFVKQ